MDAKAMERMFEQAQKAGNNDKLNLSEEVFQNKSFYYYYCNFYDN
jgi:hypothetical protein